MCDDIFLAPWDDAVQSVETGLFKRLSLEQVSWFRCHLRKEGGKKIVDQRVLTNIVGREVLLEWEEFWG